MKPYLVRAIVDEDSAKPKNEIIEDEFDDIVVATNRFDELAAKHPVELGLYKLIDSI